MKRIIAVAILVCVSCSCLAQNKQDKWVIGVSGSFVNFGENGLNTVKERFNFQIPKINVSRYMFHGLTLDAGVTLSSLKELDGFYGNAFNYFSLDGNLRYDFNLSDENLVPYIGIGASIVGAPTETLPGSKATGTLNFSFGGTFWVSPRWGLNVQGTYKYSPEEYQSMASHSQLSAGLVYSLSPRVLVYRLWDGRRAR
jgi:hypothetical protein